MNAADQPVKFTQSPVSDPADSKSATGSSEHVSSGPVVTVHPGESQPDDDNKCPAFPERQDVPKKNVQCPLGVGSEREKTFYSCAVWINIWLSGNHSQDCSYHNQSYPTSLDALSMDHIKGDHLLPFADRFAKFFSNNSLPKARGAGVLDASTKFTYFKAFRQTMYQYFPEHEELQPKDTPGWWTDLMARFKREAEQSALRDPSISIAVKSTPLYRDTSTDVNGEDFSAWGGRDIWFRAAERSE